MSDPEPAADAAPVVQGPVDDVAWLHPPITAVRSNVALAVAEDLLPLGDLTASLLPARTVEARLVSRESGVLAGSLCVTETFSAVDGAIELGWLVAEGAAVAAGTTVAVLRGPLRSIVTAERTALNFMGHLSGIATLTSRYVEEAAAHGPARIWDTRKTTPGLRSLEKAAVRAGGGRNHRGNLSDWLLVKDNHLEGMSITEAVRSARDRWPGRTVHVECDTEQQCAEAVEALADAILLDNMDPAAVRRCVQLARGSRSARGPLLEVSGGVDLATVGGYSACGVDQISVGAITNSAPVLDLGIDI